MMVGERKVNVRFGSPEWRKFVAMTVELRPKGWMSTLNT